MVVASGLLSSPYSFLLAWLGVSSHLPGQKFMVYSVTQTRAHSPASQKKGDNTR